MSEQQPQQAAPAPQPAGAPEKNVVMGVLSYIGPLVIVSYATSNSDPFVHFHVKQGFVLLAIEAAMWVLGMFIWQLYPIIGLVNIATFVLSIIGIVNVVQGNQKELPLVGSFSSYIKV